MTFRLSNNNININKYYGAVILSKNSAKAKDIALIGIFSALVIVLQLLAELTRALGLPISIALGLIPVLTASMLRGVKTGAVVGGVFGLVSLVLAAILASSMPNSTAVVIVNPLVSFVPRVLVGVFTALTYRGLTENKVLSKAKRYGFAVLSGFVGVVTNTVLFLSMFLAFSYGKTFEDATIDFTWVITAVVAINTLIEVVAFPILSAGIVSGIESYQRRGT